MMLDDLHDCTLSMGETCSELTRIGEPPVCTPGEVTDCPKEAAGFDLWGNVLASAPWVVTGILILAVVALLVLFVIQMRRTRKAERAARQAQGDAAGWRASAEATAAQARAGGVSSNLAASLVGLADLTDSPTVAAQLDHVLADAGITQMPVTVGEPFNDTVHRSVDRRETADPAQSRTIAAVIRPGYLSGSRVIRAADVAVWMVG